MNSRYVYENKWLKLREDTSSTDKEFVYTVVERVDAVIIIPLSSSKRTILLKEFRYPIQMTVWGLPMGGVDKGEDLEKAALRELSEETNIKASKPKRIGTFYPAPGLTAQKAFVFIVNVTEEDLEAASTSKLEENIKEVKIVTMDDIDEKVRNGDINEGFTLSALLILKQYLI